MKNRINFILLISIIFLITGRAAFAAANRCEEYGLGWHFYCQGKQDKEEDRNNSKLDADPQDYQEKLSEIKRTLEDKKAKAVIYPTEENLKDYMAYQKMVTDRSSKFADVWRRTLWKTPDLDYTLFRPTSKMGKEAWIDSRNQNVVNSIKRINERYGVFFLFRSDCTYCHKYSPILKSFQQKYGITIMPVSMDGGELPEWNNSLINRGQVEKMGIQVEAFPATILFDKGTRKFIPIGFGVLSHSELEERIYAITELEVGNDF